MRVRRLSVREALWDRRLNDLATEVYEKCGLEVIRYTCGVFRSQLLSQRHFGIPATKSYEK